MRVNRLLPLATSTLIAALMVTSCGKKESDSPQAAPVGKTDASVSKNLFGTWGTFVTPIKEKDTGMEAGELRMNFKIADGTLTVSSLCHFEFADVGPVEVTVPANITTKSIQILAANSDSKHWEKGSDKANCSASIAVGTMNYILDDDTLKLYESEQSLQRTLKRIK